MTVEPVTPTVSDIYWTVCDADAKVDAWLGDTQLETDPRSRLMLATSQALINARHNLAQAMRVGDFDPADPNIRTTPGASS